MPLPRFRPKAPADRFTIVTCRRGGFWLPLALDAPVLFEFLDRWPPAAAFRKVERYVVSNPAAANYDHRLTSDRLSVENFGVADGTRIVGSRDFELARLYARANDDIVEILAG